MLSHFHCTAWRWCRNTPIACRTSCTRTRCLAARVGRCDPVVVRREERIAVVARRHERLLDRARTHPADEVPERAGLVVRAGGARAAERLLPHDGAGRLVVDIEVAGRVPE